MQWLGRKKAMVCRNQLSIFAEITSFIIMTCLPPKKLPQPLLALMSISWMLISISKLYDALIWTLPIAVTNVNFNMPWDWK